MWPRIVGTMKIRKATFGFGTRYIAKMNGTVDKLNAGQGTVGQLLVNPQLYESLNGTTRELHDLLRDFRANPKKFLSIKLKIF